MQIKPSAIAIAKAYAAAILPDGQLRGQKIAVTGRFSDLTLPGVQFLLMLGGAEVVTHEHGAQLLVKGAGSHARASREQTLLTLDQALRLASLPVAADGSRPQLDELTVDARRWRGY